MTSGRTNGGGGGLLTEKLSLLALELELPSVEDDSDDEDDTEDTDEDEEISDDCEEEEELLSLSEDEEEEEDETDEDDELLEAHGPSVSPCPRCPGTETRGTDIVVPLWQSVTWDGNVASA